MIGLSSPQFLDHLKSNSGVYLYCSSITAHFLQASIRHRPLDPFVRPVPHEEPVKITVPNVAEEAIHQLCVTLIPAGTVPALLCKCAKRERERERERDRIIMKDLLIFLSLILI